MSKPLIALSAGSLLLLAGCVSSPAQAFSLGNPDACDGVSVVVNYGILSTERDVSCVEFSETEAIAGDVLSFAGIDTEGTETYGDQVVCRVNGLPSESEPFEVEGEDPYLETCADMPPAFGYWALWVKDSGQSEWAYAEEGIATLAVTPGMTVGLVFSTAGETPVPTDR
jgi:hypothetical protein